MSAHHQAVAPRATHPARQPSWARVMTQHLRLVLNAVLTMVLALGLTLAFGLAGPAALAHKASDAYLRLTQEPGAGVVRLQYSLALKDADLGLPQLDADQNRALTWGELRQALPALGAWVGQGLAWRCAEQDLAAPQWAFESLEQRSDGVYVRMAASLNCSLERDLALNYRLLKDDDPTHRLLVSGQRGAQALAAVAAPGGVAALVLTAASAPAQTPGATTGAAVNTSATSSAWLALRQFFFEGIHHLAIGYDHLAFLLALLLPISLRRRSLADPVALPRLEQERGLQRTQATGLWALVRTVTGFTIGHSITLALATLGLIAPGGNWVEPAIALSIAATAALNLWPQPWARSDLLALVFGLIHGLGFATIVSEAGIAPALIPYALAGFNLGVEAGQLMGVVLWCGLHLLLSSWAGYQRWVVRGGSWLLMLAALALAGVRLYVP